MRNERKIMRNILQQEMETIFYLENGIKLFDDQKTLFYLLIIYNNYIYNNYTYNYTYNYYIHNYIYNYYMYNNYMYNYYI